MTAPAQCRALDPSCDTAFPVLVSLLALAALVYITHRAHSKDGPPNDFYLSLLIMAAAVAGGMLVGSFASPEPGAEATQFKVVAGLVSTFATGFLFKQFEASIKEFPNWLSISSVNQVRFWLFVVALLGASVATYVYRSYYAQRLEHLEAVEKVQKDLKRLQESIDQMSAVGSPVSPASRRSEAGSAPSTAASR
jgi:hypothetical protein